MSHHKNFSDSNICIVTNNKSVINSVPEKITEEKLNENHNNNNKDLKKKTKEILQLLL